ncbi:MATE family efflux transporter [Streptomyces sp. NPDC051940]|uniref:MATE family efflux transporter n=1 Tax=Streptomyces sp. NPDC051940 TaxID=3155675 RepID=UPI0034226C2B
MSVTAETSTGVRGEAPLLHTGRRIAGAAVPLYLTLIASTAAALVDTAVLGRHGTASLAAFAVAMGVYGPATAAVASAVRGVMPYVAEKRDDAEALRPLIRHGIWLAVAVGLLGAAAVAALPLIARASGVPAATRAEFGVFPWLLAAAVPVVALSSSAASLLIGLQRNKLVMRAGLAGTGAAVTLSLLLVPRWGLPGAGVAMIASVGVNAGVGHWALRRRTVLADAPIGFGAPQPREVLRLAGVGIPLAATMLVKFGVLGVLAVAAARVGTAEGAAHGVAISLVNLMFVAAVAVGQTIVPLVAADVPAARRTVLAGVGVAVTAVATLAAVAFAVRFPLLRVFTSDAAVRDLVVGLLPFVGLAVLSDAAQAVIGSGRIGLKETGSTFLVFAAVYGVLALASVPLAAAGGLDALWAALACANVALIAGQTWVFRRASVRR